MLLKSKEEIGLGIHELTDQFFRIEKYFMEKKKIN